MNAAAPAIDGVNSRIRHPRYAAFITITLKMGRDYRCTWQGSKGASAAGLRGH